MRNLEQELTKTSGSRYFAVFDISNGYWQFPLADNSQEFQSFIMPDGIYTPRRVLHVSTNAVTYIKGTLHSIFPDKLRKNVVHWLDDIMCHASTVTDLLKTIRQLFNIMSTRNLKLYPEKCMLFTTEIRWCGPLLSADAIRFDPRRIHGIQQMDKPTDGAQLQQFFCALQGVKTCIPDLSRLVDPLHLFLETLYTRADSRKKRALARISFDNVGWGDKERSAFKACIEALSTRVTLAHRDQSKRLCVYTDASDNFWSGIMTQIPPEDTSLHHNKQRHDPLAFLSGRFDAQQARWSTLEKEAYAVLDTLQRMHWIAATPDGFDLLTDNNNFIYLFDLLSIVPEMSQTTLRKVLRWSVKLSAYNYTCIHIRGTDNVWAYLLGRWTTFPGIRRLVHIPALPSASDDDFEWPSAATIAAEKNAHSTSRPPNSVMTSGLWCTPAGSIWIPDDSSDLLLRLCLIVHVSAAGHRGANTTKRILRKYYDWSTLSVDTSEFVKAYLHCPSTTGGGNAPSIRTVTPWDRS